MGEFSVAYYIVGTSVIVIGSVACLVPLAWHRYALHARGEIDRRYKCVEDEEYMQLAVYGPVSIMAIVLTCMRLVSAAGWIGGN